MSVRSKKLKIVDGKYRKIRQVNVWPPAVDNAYYIDWLEIDHVRGRKGKGREGKDERETENVCTRKGKGREVGSGIKSLKAGAARARCGVGVIS